MTPSITRHAVTAALLAALVTAGTLLGEGPRPLLSYQTAEDSLAIHCAPSYTLRDGTEKELPAMWAGLSQGWAVVVSDYEGPQSQYGPGWQAGRAVLDGIRAAQRFPAAGIEPEAPVGLWGYSGGALATGWAAELQPAYAPELALAGAAQGGLPPDLEAVAHQIDGGEFAGILFAVSVGLDRAYPEMRIDGILNDAGKQMKEDIGELCAGDIISRYAFRSLSEYTTVEDPLSLHRMQRILAINRLGQSQPATPLYTYHAINDELIAEYCAEGVQVQYHRDPASDHNVLAGTGAPAALAYLADRFAGKAAPNTC